MKIFIIIALVLAGMAGGTAGLRAAAAAAPAQITARLCEGSADFSVAAGTRNVELMCAMVRNATPRNIYLGQMGATNTGNDAALLMGRSFSTLWPSSGEALQLFEFVDGSAELYVQSHIRKGWETKVRFIGDIAPLGDDVAVGDTIQMNLVCDATHYCMIEVEETGDRIEGGELSLFLAGPTVTITE